MYNFLPVVFSYSLSNKRNSFKATACNRRVWKKKRGKKKFSIKIISQVRAQFNSNILVPGIFSLFSLAIWATEDSMDMMAAVQRLDKIRIIQNSRGSGWNTDSQCGYAPLGLGTNNLVHDLAQGLIISPNTAVFDLKNEIFKRQARYFQLENWVVKWASLQSVSLKNHVSTNFFKWNLSNNTN